MSIPAGQLTLASNPSPTYQLHPVVVFSILDHYKRRHPNQQRVIGTLVGERVSADVVSIKASFPVPHQEDESNMAVDMDYHHSMLQLHKQAAPRDVVVGWYSTGDAPTYVSSLMHQVYRTQVPAPHQPLLLMVDVNVSHLAMPVKAFEESQIAVNGQPALALFTAVQLVMHAYDEERIGVLALIDGEPDDHKRLDAPATILTESEQLYRAVGRLMDAIQVCHAYVQAVREGKIEGDAELATAIHAALNVIPTVDPASFQTLFASHVQDLLMIVYLAGLTKTQLLMADQVNALLQ